MKAILFLMGSTVALLACYIVYSIISAIVMAL